MTIEKPNQNIPNQGGENNQLETGSEAEKEQKIIEAVKGALDKIEEEVARKIEEKELEEFKKELKSNPGFLQKMYRACPKGIQNLIGGLMIYFAVKSGNAEAAEAALKVKAGTEETGKMDQGKEMVDQSAQIEEGLNLIASGDVKGGLKEIATTLLGEQAKARQSGKVPENVDYKMTYKTKDSTGKEDAYAIRVVKKPDGKVLIAVMRMNQEGEEDVVTSPFIQKFILDELGLEGTSNLKETIKPNKTDAPTIKNEQKESSGKYQEEVKDMINWVKGKVSLGYLSGPDAWESELIRRNFDKHPEALTELEKNIKDELGIVAQGSKLEINYLNLLKAIKRVQEQK